MALLPTIKVLREGSVVSDSGNSCNLQKSRRLVQSERLRPVIRLRTSQAGADIDTKVMMLWFLGVALIATLGSSTRDASIWKEDFLVRLALSAHTLMCAACYIHNDSF